MKSTSGLGFSIAGGIGSGPFRDKDNGIFVSKVVPLGPADTAGLQIGDKVVSVSTLLSTSLKSKDFKNY